MKIKNHNMVKYEPTVKEIQDILLQGMVRFRDFCDAHDIRYSLAYGTLLGAVRNQDFIPWDDDADIFMIRSEYEKLISLASEIEDDEWELVSNRLQNGYYTPWMKFSHKKTKLYPSRLNSGFVYGLSFDIFPVDFIDAKSEEEALQKAVKIHGFYTEKVHKIAPFETLKPGAVNHVKGFFKKIYHQLIGTRIGSITKICYAMDQKLAKTKPSDTNYACNIFGTLTFVYHSSAFTGPEKNVILRGEMFKAPYDYDHILAVRYGKDYMVPPPVSEQVSNHNYTLMRER